MKKLLFYLIPLATIFGSCSSEDDPAATDEVFDARILNFTQIQGVFDTLSFDGVFTDVTVSKAILVAADNQETDLEVTAQSDSEVSAFVPANVPGGDYSVTLVTSEGDVTTNTFDELLTVTIQQRPVITSISKTTLKAGDEITINGIDFINDSGESIRDPKVWIMAVGYTNTVSDIVVNQDGNSATITISDAVDPGTYNLSITVDESDEFYTSWSNEIEIEVIE